MKYGIHRPITKDTRPLPLYSGFVTTKGKASHTNEGHIETLKWMHDEWWYVVNGSWEAESCLENY